MLIAYENLENLYIVLLNNKLQNQVLFDSLLIVLKCTSTIEIEQQLTKVV